MRYDKTVYLIKKLEEAFDEETGNYIEKEPIIYERQAHVSSAGISTLNNLYGGIQEGAIVIRLKTNYLEFDEIKYGDKIYLPKMIRPLRDEVVIHCVEKQVWK